MKKLKIYLLKEDVLGNSHSIADEIIGFTYNKNTALKWKKESKWDGQREIEEIMETLSETIST